MLDKYFYTYYSPFVIAQAAGLYIYFKSGKIQGDNKIIEKICMTFANASLVTYIIHMHPIIKNNYVDIRLLEFVNVKNIIYYIVDFVGILFIILAAGIMISYPLLKVSRYLSVKIEKLFLLCINKFNCS